MLPPDEMPESFPAELPEPEEIPFAELVSPPVRCWRCERIEVPRAGRCPVCDAKLTSATSGPARRSQAYPARRRESHPLKLMLVAYFVMLAVSVVWGWFLLANGTRMTKDHVTTGTVMVEAIDAFLVIVAIGLVGLTPLPDRPPQQRAVAWIVSWPVLAVLVCVGTVYIGLIREYINPPRFAIPEAMELNITTLLTVCIQPALFEELFFRYLALGVLSRVTGLGTAVLISSVMFAMAHIYNPLGLPYLFVVGVVLGYARVYGGLLLPMILHFLHNLAVILIEVA